MEGDMALVRFFAKRAIAEARAIFAKRAIAEARAIFAKRAIAEARANFGGGLLFLRTNTLCGNGRVHQINRVFGDNNKV